MVTYGQTISVIHTNNTKGQAGVGIALNKKWGTRVTNVVAYSSRLCLVKVESTPVNLAIIQVYMPTSKSNDEEVEEVYAGIEELLKHTKPHDNVIIMEGREVGDFSLGKRNERGERVEEFCRENGMIITNTRFQNPKRRIYTWKMPDDIIYCDHNLVIAKCELRYKKPQRPKVQQEKYSVRLLKKAEYIEELYEGEKLEEITIDEEETKLPILKSEFELALHDLKQNKAPEIDDITAELLQCASTKIKDALYQLTQDIYEKGDVPDDYRKRVIVTILKKSGTNSQGKVEQYIKNDQYGFRRQKGIREAILGLRVLIEKQIDRNKVTYLAFIDLKKAFDKVNWNKMLLILREIGVEQQDLRIGVRQECTLSPPLFNYYIEKVINTVKAKLTRLNIGIKIGGEIVSMIRFADDIVVIAESEGDIQCVVEEMDEMIRTSEMKINSTKTKILFCARDPKVKADVYIDAIRERRWKMVGHAMRHPEELHSIILEDKTHIGTQHLSGNEETK
ncbi:craniofacial development protein 2-like [Aphis craccivora]|uniref:Craniofacial development protein 2-like n=1 Tax=Aphis craccivora TaxID=307492 RepID=A0A6G0YDQ9_APHCR|nr:craniofacial development protein 2-like [Aphis craccivora]